jgi:hypothetical protein
MKKSVVILLIAGFGAAAVIAASPSDREDRAVAASVANLAKMHRVTEKPFLMDRIASTRCDVRPSDLVQQGPHSDAYCHVFVNDAGQETLKSGSGSYAAGTVIIKQKFLDKEGTKPALFTVMRKMEPGYDAEHGDWEYSIVDRSGTKVFSRGKTNSCIECHAAYKETDYVTRAYMPKP